MPEALVFTCHDKLQEAITISQSRYDKGIRVYAVTVRSELVKVDETYGMISRVHVRAMPGSEVCT